MDIRKCPECHEQKYLNDDGVCPTCADGKDDWLERAEILAEETPWDKEFHLQDPEEYLKENFDHFHEEEERAVEELTDISGVGLAEAEYLYRAGYESIDDIREAKRSELSDVEFISNALAARIKSDVRFREDNQEDEVPDVIKPSEDNPVGLFLEENIESDYVVSLDELRSGDYDTLDDIEPSEAGDSE